MPILKQLNKIDGSGIASKQPRRWPRMVPVQKTALRQPLAGPHGHQYVCDVHKASDRRRRHFPHARADLRFQSAPGGLALDDPRGRRSGPVSLIAALVLTYCDGSQDAQAIANAIARALGGDAATVRADVERMISDFAEAGLVN